VRMLWERAAQPVQQPGAEPDGRLHADGYFTWKRRDGYVLDAKLPCDFYLAAPAQRQPLSDEQRRAIYKNAREAVEATWPHGRNFVDFVVDGVEAAHGITAAGAAEGEKL